MSHDGTSRDIRPSLALHHQVFGAGEPVIILHGLLGSGTNWRTVGRKLAERYRVILPDARNHGRSPHADEMHYQNQAQDVSTLLDTLGVKAAHVIGHSMGGKTAMVFANQTPAKTKSLTVVDIAPTSYPFDPQSEQRQLMETMATVPLDQITSRKAADRILAERVDDSALRAFALLNLERDDDQFRWRINLSSLLETLPTLRSFPTLAPPIFSGPTHFVHGANSTYVADHHIGEIQTLFPNLAWSEIENAGHWLHAEQPAAFLHVVTQFFDRVCA